MYFMDKCCFGGFRESSHFIFCVLRCPGVLCKKNTALYVFYYSDILLIIHSSLECLNSGVSWANTNCFEQRKVMTEQLMESSPSWRGYRFRCDTEKEKVNKKRGNMTIIFRKDFAISCQTCIHFLFSIALDYSFNGRFQEKGFRSNLQKEGIRSVNRDLEGILWMWDS